jgi:hypothetical protein
VVSVRNHVSEFLEEYGSDDRVVIYETSLDELNDLDRVLELFDVFNLKSERSELEEIVGRKVNER